VKGAPTMKIDEDNYQSYKRLKSFWDPIFSPATIIKFSFSDWNFLTTTGIKNTVFLAEKINSTEGASIILSDITFTDCDFIGDFSKHKIAFSGCKFTRCDFGRSYWRNSKFNNCEFNASSLSLVKFENCQFIECKWFSIGFSGNETRFISTWMTNPEEFVKSGYTNKDKNILNQFGTSPQYQVMRLEVTKSQIAKMMLKNQELLHDDKSYYNSIKIYLTQSIKARMAESSYEIKNGVGLKKLRSFFLFFSLWLDIAILSISGFINSWGSSISRPAIAGFIVSMIFTLIYYYLGVKPSFLSSAMASFDITLVAGYTKHSSTSSTHLAQFFYAVNLFFGLWWYAIMVPTVINRISRVR
jgi:hypothetical protein